MANVTIYNRSNTTVSGTVNDRLTFIYTAATNDVWLTAVTPAGTGAETPASGYSGTFNGMGYNDCPFTGFGHFTFIDQSGGNDWIVTGDGNDSLVGGNGNDSLYGNGGRDTIDGGAGGDRALVRVGWYADNVVVNLNGVSAFADGAVLRNVESIDLLTGAGNDNITGHLTAVMQDVIRTGAGNDRITMRISADDLAEGGAGNDVLDVTYAVVTNDVWLTNLTASVGGGYSGTFDGYGGNNLSFTGIERFRFQDLSAGNDIIQTGAGADTLLGGGGNDTLRGGAGADYIDGGAGALDYWQGRLGAATAALTINLNLVSTTIPGGSVRAIEGMDLATGAGNDALTVHRTADMYDVLSAGAGNDTMSFWDGGTDSAAGGAGDDLLRLVWEGATTGVWLNPVTAGAGGYSGRFDGVGGNDLSFSGINRFYFNDVSGGADIIHTGAGNDTLYGGGGDDHLDVGSGRDVANGGTGNDRWQADLSANGTAVNLNLNLTSSYHGTGRVAGFEVMTLTSGAGNDTITGHNTAAFNDTIVSGGGNDRISLHAGGTDNVTGGAGNDTLIWTYATATNDVWMFNLTATVGGGWSGLFNGMGGTDVGFAGIENFGFYDQAGGNDIIVAQTGRDTLSGGLGNDQLDGGAGADTLIGGGGDDWLTGGLGGDRQTGGAGVDRFQFNRTVNEGSDLITDFTNGADLIRIVGGSMADVALASVNGGVDTLVTLDSGTVILLDDVARATITAADFVFV